MSPTCTKDRLAQEFSQFGDIDKTYILYDHNNGSSRGFGFVEFVNEDDVSKALQAAVFIDNKPIKCSRVILKQESKMSHQAEVKSSKDAGDHVQNTANKLTQKNAKTKKRVKQSDLKKDRCSHDRATKESSLCSSCERKDPIIKNNHLEFKEADQKNNESCLNSQNQNSKELPYYSQNGFYDKQPQSSLDNDHFNAFNFGIKHQVLTDFLGFGSHTPFNQHYGQQSYAWQQSIPQTCSSWVHRASQQCTSQRSNKKLSYYRMF